MALVHGMSTTGLISLTHPELSATSRRQREEQILEVVIAQLRELIGGRIHIDEAESSKQEKLKKLFTTQELMHLLASWIDDIHIKVIKTMSFVQDDIKKPCRFNKAERKHLLQRMRDLYDAFHLAAKSLDLYIEHGSMNIDGFADVFKKYREALILAENIRVDPSFKQSQSFEVDQQLIIYAPYWIPILVPLFRKI